MLNRVIGVLKLDVATYEEIEHDEAATTQAAIIVTIIAVLSAIGGYLGAQAASSLVDSMGDLSEMGFDIPMDSIANMSPFGAAIAAFLGVYISWLLWSVLTYFIGTKLFGGVATIPEMMRVLGFAQAPQLLNVLSFIPCLGVIISIVAAIWSLVCGFIGVRQGLDIDNTKTLITVVISWLVAFLVNMVVVNPLLGLLL